MERKRNLAENLSRKMVCFFTLTERMNQQQQLCLYCNSYIFNNVMVEPLHCNGRVIDTLLISKLFTPFVSICSQFRL